MMKKKTINNKNFEHLGGSIYRAENQVGFNAALYDYFGAEEHKNSLSKNKIRKMVKDGDGSPNWPTKYPAIFQIIDQSFECSRVSILILDKIEAMNKNDNKENAIFDDSGVVIPEVANEQRSIFDNALSELTKEAAFNVLQDLVNRREVSAISVSAIPIISQAINRSKFGDAEKLLREIYEARKDKKDLTIQETSELESIRKILRL